MESITDIPVGVQSKRNPELRTFIDERIEEARKERSNHEPAWDINLRRYLGDHWDQQPKKGRKQFTNNVIKDTVIRKTAIQTEETPRTQFAAVEANESPRFVIRSEARPVAQQLGVTELWVDEQTFMQLTQPIPMVDQFGQAAIDPMTGQPVVTQNMTEDMFLPVTDHDVADALTKLERVQWNRADGDAFLQTNVLNTNIIGHQDALLQYDAENYKRIYCNLHQTVCWIDPHVESCDMGKSEYYIITEPKSVDEATMLLQKKFSIDREMAKAMIDESAGSIQDSSYYGHERSPLGRRYQQGHSDREVVWLTTMWYRNHPFPLSPDEALGEGVQQVAVPNPETGTVEQGFVGEDGLPTQPGDENWPTRFGIRQVQMLCEYVLDDREVEFCDIPVSRNINFAIPHCSYGTSDAQDLWDLNDLYNRLWSIFHNHFLYYQATEKVIPASVYEELKDSLQSLHSHGGKSYIIPDELLMMFGGQDVIKYLSPPELSGAIAQLIQHLRVEIDRVAGMADVLRGEAKSEWSGETVAQLQNLAKGPIGYTARYTAAMLKRSAKIFIDADMKFMPSEEIAKHITSYPVEFWDYVRERYEEIDFDVMVEVGGQGSKERARAETLELFQLGLIDQQAVLDRVEFPGAASVIQRMQAAQQAALEQQAMTEDVPQTQ